MGAVGAGRAVDDVHVVGAVVLSTCNAGSCGAWVCTACAVGGSGACPCTAGMHGGHSDTQQAPCSAPLPPAALPNIMHRSLLDTIGPRIGFLLSKGYRIRLPTQVPACLLLIGLLARAGMPATAEVGSS